MFEIGKVYNRRRDIHGAYGGQQQGGISTPANEHFIFLFTSKTGEHYGYSDRWTDDGVFLFAGEGQTGDMQFTGGNNAVRDHATTGKSLYLFESLGKGKGYRYTNEFICESWHHENAPDVNGDQRQAIIFHLVPMDTINEAIDSGLFDSTATADLVGRNLDDLRNAAYSAASEAVNADPSDAKRAVYQRSKIVRDYVLCRANGCCESCGKHAPFNRKKDATPYLEPHHIRRLSDGGPDNPQSVAAICPNCHREIHCGEFGDQKNRELQQVVMKLENQRKGL